jgi:glycerol-3-phosphate dehydrogenase subunit B
MTDLLIIGAGLTGLYSAAFAASEGASVTLVTKGRGGLAMSHGCIDIWARPSPARSIRRLRKSHPYQLTGIETLQEALAFLTSITMAANLPYEGKLTRNFALPTATGTLRATAFAPPSLARGTLKPSDSVAIAGFHELRDFYPSYTAQNLQRQGIDVQGVLMLPLIDVPLARDIYATDIARRFDSSSWREAVARAWKPRLTGIRRLGLPAVLGLEDHQNVYESLQEGLGLELFEIPTLPPCVPGIRLENLLRNNTMKSGVRFIEGSSAIGRIDAKSGGNRVDGVVLQTAGGPRIQSAEKVLLATGGFLNGGLVGRKNGHVHESVFDLPVSYTEGRMHWTTASPLESQPYELFGIKVDDHMRPLGVDGPPFENLFAAGGLLSGAYRTREGSRQGIDLATAHRAVEVALQ